MSRLILPGHVPPRGGLTILVPRGYETDTAPEPIAVCRVPTGPGEVCGLQFFAGEERAWQRHVGICAKEHEQAIHAESPRQRLPMFQPEAWDPEVSRHMRRIGERMLREGRMVVRKSERAGF